MVPYLRKVCSFMVLGRAFIVVSCQISKFHGHSCKFQVSPSLRELYQLRFLQLAISWSRITLGNLFLPGSVDHGWTTPGVCINGDFDPLQRHSYSPINYWGHRVYIELWGPVICHAFPAVSITSKDLPRFQIVLRNPSVKFKDTVCLHPLIN